MIAKRAFLLLIFASFFSLFHPGNGIGNRLKFRNLHCNASSLWFTNTSCVIKAINRNKRVADMYTVALKKLTDLNIVIRTYRRFNGWRPGVINGKANFCDMMRGKFNPVFNIIKKMLLTYSNLNHSCPFYGPLFAKGMDLDLLDTKFSILPEGIVRGEFKFFVGKIQISQVTADIEIIEL